MHGKPMQQHIWENRSERSCFHRDRPAVYSKFRMKTGMPSNSKFNISIEIGIANKQTNKKTIMP